MRNALVKALGSLAPLIHSDTGTMDRWLWVKKRLAVTRNGERLLDVGCGTGAFTICAAERGYDCLGLTWDGRDQQIAQARADICGTPGARFRVVDVRRLGAEADLAGAFDVVLCCENIEHILDDRRLMHDMFRALKPGGRLLLTSPWHHYDPISPDDAGPFLKVETGWHVRRGYTRCMLEELCRDAGFMVEEIDYNVGWLSQLTIRLFQRLKFFLPLAWLAILPLRLIVPLVDRRLTILTGRKFFSICLEAYRPRLPQP